MLDNERYLHCRSHSYADCEREGQEQGEEPYGRVSKIDTGDYSV